PPRPAPVLPARPPDPPPSPRRRYDSQRLLNERDRLPSSLQRRPVAAPPVEVGIGRPQEIEYRRQRLRRVEIVEQRRLHPLLELVRDRRHRRRPTLSRWRRHPLRELPDMRHCPLRRLERRLGQVE